MTDVFLMGTSGRYDDPKRSMWREPIKTECARYGITCYDPVLPVWEEKNAQMETQALLEARLLVMAITTDTAGVASLAESGWAVLSALLRKQSVGMFVDPSYQGEKSTMATMMVRIDQLFNNEVETIE